MKHVLFDKQTDKTFMLTDFEMKTSDLERLEKNNITFVNIDKMKDTEANTVAHSLISSMGCDGNGAMISDLINAAIVRIAPESMVQMPASAIGMFIGRSLKSKCVDAKTRSRIECIHLTKKEYDDSNIAKKQVMER